MARFADRADFTVRWLPFQLVPDLAKEGVNKLEYYNKRFGPQRVAQMVPAMARWAHVGAWWRGCPAVSWKVLYSLALVHVMQLRPTVVCMRNGIRTGSPFIAIMRRSVPSCPYGCAPAAARASHTCRHHLPP